jgi:dienelactone hydrolase
MSTTASINNDLRFTRSFLLVLILGVVGFLQRPAQLLAAETVPRTLQELWADFDELDRSTPLETEVLRTWTQETLTCQIVRYQVGVFKGQPVRVAGFFAFPSSTKGLAALLHLHGGGQAASLDTTLTYARRGYAILSLNWGGNPLRIGNEVFTGPQTDWGRLDATHPPQRNAVNHFAGPLTPDAYTLDAVESPRNSNWYLVLLAARRALSFLQQQPQVDPRRLGVFGHSMGGKLTTNVAGVDRRLRVAVPSCGGSGELTAPPEQMPGGVRVTRSELELACISDNAYLPEIRCPILWLSPTNDFHGVIDNMAWNWRTIPDEQVRFSISLHHNHRHADAQAITEYLFFEQHLQQRFTLPQTPRLAIHLDTPDGVPEVRVTADESQVVERVEVYYSQDSHAITRFWRAAAVTVAPGRSDPSGKQQTQASSDARRQWHARCPLFDLQQPMLVFANVIYQLPEPYQQVPQVAGQKNSKTFVLSSRLNWKTGDNLRQARVQATSHPERLIDDGSHPWRDWFQLNWDHPPLWTAVTRKLKDPQWRGPDHAALVFEVQSETDNQLVITVTTNGWGSIQPGRPAIEYAGRIPLKGASNWQTVTVRLADLQAISPLPPPTASRADPSRAPGTEPPSETARRSEIDRSLNHWQAVTELSISPSGTIWMDGQRHKSDGKPWQGSRLIRQLRWEMSATPSNSVR